MKILLWFGVGLLAVIVWLVVSAICLCDSADEYINRYLSGEALCIYIAVILFGFIGAFIISALSFIAFIEYFSENFEFNYNLGKKFYNFINNIFKRKKDE